MQTKSETELSGELETLRNQSESLRGSLARLQADFDNYRKITERECVSLRERLLEGLIRRLLDHYEDLMRASKVLKNADVDESTMKGFNMIVQNFERLLADEGVRQIPVYLGKEKLDPYKHEAILVENDDRFEENTVLEMIDAGFDFLREISRNSA